MKAKFQQDEQTITSRERDEYFDLVSFLMDKIIECKYTKDRICIFDEIIWVTCDEYNEISYWESKKYRYSLLRNELQLEIVQEVLTLFEQINLIGDIWFSDMEIHQSIELCLRFISQLLQYTDIDWSDQYHGN